MHFAAWNGNVGVVELLTDPTYITAQNGDTGEKDLERL